MISNMDYRSISPGTGSEYQQEGSIMDIGEDPGIDILREIFVDGHVGIDALPDQHVKKQSYSFNVLCIGESGVGKSTLMDSLFNLDAEGSKAELNMWSPSAAVPRLPPVGLLKRRHELMERGVELKLTIVESVGYGDQLNKEECYKALENYIDEQFEAYFREELKIERCLPLYQDTRIHACLYFICPTGNGLKAIDLLCMKHLHEKVNIIPVIAKADALSKPELQSFKKSVMFELKSNGVEVYDFPLDEDDCGTCRANAEIPFAVVGSCDFVQIGNKMVRGRKYPWGIVQVENENHCDFVRLREMLIRTNMIDLKERTHATHYEKYRLERLTQLGFNDDGESFQEMFKQKLHLQLQDLSRKEDEIKQKFMAIIREKDSELQTKERQIWTRYDGNHETQLREKRTLDELMNHLEDEIAEFKTLAELYETQQHNTPNKKMTKNNSGSSNSTFYLGTLGRLKKSA